MKVKAFLVFLLPGLLLLYAHTYIKYIYVFIYTYKYICYIANCYLLLNYLFTG